MLMLWDSSGHATPILYFSLRREYLLMQEHSVNDVSLREPPILINRATVHLVVLPPSWFIGHLCSSCQILTKYLANKMLMHVNKNYIVGFVFQHSFQ